MLLMQHFLGSMEKMISRLTWTSFKSWVKKLWAWCKKNWKFFVGVATACLIFVLTRKGVNVSKILKRVREDHEKEIEIIDNAHELEIKKREDAQKRYFEILEDLEKKYRDAERELDKKKQKEIRRLLDEHGDNPEELTAKIAELTGFSISP